MATFSETVTAVYAEVPHKSPNTLARVKDAIVRALRHARSIPSPAFEGETYLDTVADDETYTTADMVTVGGLDPAGDITVDLAWTVTGDAKVFLKGPLAPLELRHRYPLTAYWPLAFGWTGSTLYLAPKPTGVIRVYMIYRIDPLRNAADGVAITAASTTQTNAWLTEGYEYVWAQALGYYFSGTDGRDPAMAESYLGQARSFLEDLERRQRVQRPVGRIPMYLGGSHWSSEYHPMKYEV